MLPKSGFFQLPAIGAKVELARDGIGCMHPVDRATQAAHRPFVPL